MEKQKPGFVKTEYDDLTYKVNGLAMKVHDELKPGHPEKFFQRRLAQLCRESDLEVEFEKRVEVYIEESLIGFLKLDLWVEGILVVECKAFSHQITQDEIGQVLTYLAATSSPIGMIYNFGRERLEMKRIFAPLVIQDWQKYLYRFIHRNAGMKLPPLPSEGQITKGSDGVPPIRFKSLDQKPSHVEIPSPVGAAIRLSVSRQQSVDQSSYAAAGVNINAGNRAVELMKSAANATHGSEVLAGIGSFGGLFSAGAIKDMDDPVLVASTDGVGTKVMLAAQTGRYAGVGQDIVNHCMNDILVQGARPLFFMDYFASSKIIPEIVAEIVGGMAEACKIAGCALLGGETAEMPGVYGENHFDVVGTIVGVVERSKLLPVPDIEPGDLLVGLGSSGPHTNGYSLIRRVFANFPLEEQVPELGLTLADAILKPHRSYLSLLEPVLQADIIKGLAHITGGGFFDNIPRILPKGCGAVIHPARWPTPPLFRLIQQHGEINPAEMFRVFNMGVGMVVVVAPEELHVFQSSIPEETWLIGEVIEGDSVSLVWER